MTPKENLIIRLLLSPVSYILALVKIIVFIPVWIVTQINNYEKSTKF